MDFFLNGYNVKYFGSVGVVHIPKETKNLISNRNMTINKKVCRTLNYIEFFLVSAFAFTEYFSFLLFAALVGVSRGIMNTEAGLKICLLTAVIQKHKQ